MSLKLAALAALALTLSPAFALSRPFAGSTTHQRPNLFHDRSPKPHAHVSLAHH